MGSSVAKKCLPCTIAVNEPGVIARSTKFPCIASEPKPQLMASEPIFGAILSWWIESAQRGRFNGLVADSLLRFEDNPDRLRAHLASLVDEHKVTCVFASTQLNMHIKRLPDLPIDRQRALVKAEALKEFCVYPTASEIAKNIDITQWNDRPFSKELALAKPQLAYRAFDMAALERYTRDPRYVVHFQDYMGSMSIRNESFSDQGFPDRDKVSLQTFGIGIDNKRIPHVVVYLRYLARLSSEHQQYWSSYLASGDVRTVFSDERARRDLEK